MPKLRLTDAAVKRINAPAGAERVDYWDSALPGFGIRVSASGARRWVIITRVLTNGTWKQRRVVLGAYPAKSLAEARQDARDAFVRAEQGKDPASIPRARREAMESDSRNTFESVATEFLGKYRTRGKKRPSARTLAEMDRVFRHQAFADWRKRPLAEITRRDVMDSIDTFMERGHERAANLYLRYLAMLFGWAVDRSIIQTDPTTRIKPPGAERSRERVLTLDELRQIWQATEPTGNSDLFSAIIRVLMLTGQRRSEVGGMCWSEIDIDAATWHLPGTRTKNRRAHQVPLSEPVVDILRKRQREQADMRLSTDLAFSSNGKTAFCGWSKSKKRLDGKAGLASWTIHDLRRTLVTHMGEDLHILPHVVESIANHVSGVKSGIAGVYNKALYLDERRAALDAWANYVLSVVIGKPAKNVIRLDGR